MRALRLAWLLLLAAWLSCADPGSPTGPAPNPSPTPGPRCRTVATRMTLSRATTPSGISAAGVAECRFARSELTLSCTSVWTFANGCPLTSTSERVFGSVREFAGEHAPVGRRLALRETVTDEYGAGCSGREQELTSFFYDGQRRLQRVATAATSHRTEATLTAWDGAGRPIAGTWTDFAFCVGLPVAIEYDDARRRTAWTVADPSSPCYRLEVVTMDENRNVIETAVTTGPGLTTVTTRVAIEATQEVCE